MKPLCLLVVAALLAGAGSVGAASRSFVAVKNDAGFRLPEIIIAHDVKAGTGFDWKQALARPANERSDLGKIRDSALFLQEAVRKMTGKTLAIRNDADLSRGLILTTLAAAPPELRGDAAISTALRNDGSDGYNDREAFYLRSEPDRLLIVAHTADGLAAGVVELLESVGYEVLGMGPNWIHVPADKRERLLFDLERSGRPSYYIRGLNPTSGQGYGVGTIMPGPRTRLTPPDEPVTASLARWSVGARILGQSMPGFPGHALQAYHRPVVEKMKQTNTTDGFLVPKAHLDLDEKRPAPGAENAGHLWINSDPKGKPGFGKVYLSDGKKWSERNLAELGVNLDLSVPLVRNVILEEMKRRAEIHFSAHPDAVFVFATDPEDGGGYADLARFLHDRNWYPDHRKAAGRPLGEPYVLHGFRGLDQPRELWDPAAPSDTVFGFDNWLLHEFDQWIDSLPEKERRTATGKSKKDLARCSFYSYNYHDVPPNFNLDPRIRVMIASYPKHRGIGKWKKFATQQGLAQAFKVMLPREPSGDYRIISLAYYWDPSPEGIPAPWSAAPERIADDLRSTYRAGIRALNYEVDFNFGKFGLANYLLSKMLWNANLSAAELDALRDRWLQRAHGGGWKEMKAYYDFLLPGNYPANAPNTWAKAIRLIDAAGRKIDPGKEPDARARLDDLKQFWYYHYLLQSGQGTKTARPMQEFAWKGQMSYMVAMHVVLRRTFGTSSVAEAVPEEIRMGPAHYSHEETQAWWQKVLDFWPLTPVTRFTEATLADGTKGRDVDLNDLVRVRDFQALPGGGPFLYNSGYMKPAPFLTVAREGEEIGFKLSWPALSKTDRYYIARDLPYGVEFWDAKAGKWQPIVDKTMTVRGSTEVDGPKEQKRQLVEVRLKAPRTGTYRFDLGHGGNLALLTHLGYDVSSGKFTTRAGQTYFTTAEGLTQDPTWIYIPKGTRSLDLEVWDGYNAKKLTLFKGLSAKGLTVSRQVDVSKRGTHRVELQPGEDGTLARLEGNGFAFPFLYSVPPYWAKAPAELLVPRAIAVADRLGIEAP
jgi:hypothetical protein